MRNSKNGIIVGIDQRLCKSVLCPFDPRNRELKFHRLPTRSGEPRREASEAKIPAPSRRGQAHRLLQ